MTEYNPGDTVKKPGTNIVAIRVDSTVILAGEWFIFDPAAGGAGYYPQKEIDSWLESTDQPEVESPA